MSKIRLTPREYDVLIRITRENTDIANELAISPLTVLTHMHSVYKKLGVKTKAQAVLKAIRLNLVDECCFML